VALVGNWNNGPSPVLLALTLGRRSPPEEKARDCGGIDWRERPSSTTAMAATDEWVVVTEGHRAPALAEQLLDKVADLPSSRSCCGRPGRGSAALPRHRTPGNRGQ